MKASLLIVLSLSALALAGPAINKNANNQIGTSNKNAQQQYMTGDLKQTQATETLKQWCFSSHMSQTELTASFKKLVGVVKSSPEDQSTEAAVMSERICQNAAVQKEQTQGSEIPQVDAQAHELIKDVYMDALLACDSRQCMQQLIKIINSNQVDAIRASYYMTRIAVTEKTAIKDDTEVKQLAESFLNQQVQSGSELIERQKLFATTALLGKSLESKQQSAELKQVAQQVAKAIVERYIKPVSEQEIEQYQKQQPQQQSSEVASKVAKRSAALKALANIPSFVLKEIKSVEAILVEIAQNKSELSTARQSAIECLEQNDDVIKQLKQLTFAQEEPTEVRIAAYRALMSSLFAGATKDEQSKQQQATEIVDEVIKHCEEPRNQQQDDQFVFYVITHLDNLRTSQQPEYQAIKEIISKNKQHYMQIQLLCKKFKQQLSDVRKSSRNYKLEQEFNQLESGLIIQGDLIYESKHKSQQLQQHMPESWNVLPKVVRFNVSMPVMGETVNVAEITVRQNQMDEELLSALKLVQTAKFDSESMSKVVDSFKTSVQQQVANKQQQTAEADLTIKVDGATIVYVCVDDFKSIGALTSNTHQRNIRSVYSAVEEILEHLKRNPVAFNRGFNFNINERLAKVLDVEANIIAGLRFDSRAQGQSSSDFEIVTQVEPRFAFEAIVGPAKMSSKKLLQRISTKSALGLRLRFKQDELVDVQVDLPMNTMELFTIETQMVEKSTSTPYSYTYLPESIYGQEDIYSTDEEFTRYQQIKNAVDEVDYPASYVNGGIRKMKKSIFESGNKQAGVWKFMQGNKQAIFAHSVEVPEEIARATGLRGKLRVVASPNDLSFFAQAVAQKYEPAMRGYRVQVQTVQQRGSVDQEEYILALSTPGSRVERSVQVRVVKQTGAERTIVKTEIVAPKMSAVAQYELIYDGREYSLRTFVASTRASHQWRHSFECGVQRGAQAQPGRVAATYKPYMTIESSFLKRPIQMQGVVSYQQSPKPVIKFELKSPNNSNDYLQGKIELMERSIGKRASGVAFSYRRAMQSPIELLLSKDLTVSADFVAQVYEQAIKVHQMIDWDADKWAVQAELSAAHKNIRKSTLENQILASLKLDQDQQMVSVQRKCPQNERKEFRLTLTSDCKTQGLHQFLAEYRFNGKRSSATTSGLQSVIAYKHKVDYTTMQTAAGKLQLAYTIELVNTEYQFNEKLTGRTLMAVQPKQTTVQCELQSRNKLAKFDLDFVSIKEHQITFLLQADQQFNHRTSVRADKRQVSLISRTDKQGQMLAKLALEYQKEQGQTQLIVEMPLKNIHLVADLKPESGRLSSIALQSPRFTSNVEFSFDSMKSGSSSSGLNNRSPLSSWLSENNKFQMPINAIRFKSDLRDVMNQDAYWVDSAIFGGDNRNKQSYLRFDSPVHRADLVFDPVEDTVKFGAFARSKRSTSYGKLYSNDDSSITSAPFGLFDKLWSIRSTLLSPLLIQKEILKGLIELATQSQSHKHSFEWNPTETRLSFDLNRQPNSNYAGVRYQPFHLTGDLNTAFFNTFDQSNEDQKISFQRPSTLAMQSEWVDFDMDAMPFNGESCYAKLNAVSRHRRSPFKKHESEIRYSDKHGYKAMMKHQDAKNKQHSWELEADQNPKKWAKLAYESDKHGKASYEHQWRKHMNKREHQQYPEGQDVYSNKIAIERQPLNRNDWTHRTQLSWDEQAQKLERTRRDIFSGEQRKYNLVDALNHIESARLQSVTSRNQADLYNLDFDYQPESHATLNVMMPNEMSHLSSLEFVPSERLYKIQSRLFNRLTNEPSYELLASTKPFIAGQEWAQLSQQQQQQKNQQLTQFLRSALAQPLKLDYTDKYGRVARVDYDLSPLASISPATIANKYAGLRQKRAALYYKDSSNNVEHQSSYDFYPESVFGLIPSSGMETARRVPGDFMMKTQTKFGPIMLHADSRDQTLEVKLESPVLSAKLVGEVSGSKRSAKIVKITVDNKQKTVQLTKIVRKIPILSECEIVEMLAQMFDSSRFEHQTEMLLNQYEAKMKSQTFVDKRPVIVVEGELNKHLNKAIVKITGEHLNGQMLVDLMSQTGSLMIESTDKKQAFYHKTRLAPINKKFFSVESMTTYKQQPLFKLAGKVSSMIFSEPEHLFSRRQTGVLGEEHISTFEATVYEPKKMQVSGQIDCLRKEARVIVKDDETQKVQQSFFRYDVPTNSLTVDARLNSPAGPIYAAKGKINMQGLIEPSKCRYQSCQSELVYSDVTGLWTAKYNPNEIFSVNTPIFKREMGIMTPIVMV